MPVSRFMLIVIIAFLVPPVYAGASVCQTMNGITITAQAMSCRDGEVTFGQDLCTQRIYPIRLCLRNEKQHPLSFSIKSSAVSLAQVLTPESLKASISVASGVASVMTIFLFPLGLCALWQEQKLKELLSVVEEFSMRQAVIIEPGNSYQAYVFPQFPRPSAEYLNDEQGNRLRDEHGKRLPAKRPAFVAPESLDVTINFVVDQRSISSAVRFSLPVQP